MAIDLPDNPENGQELTIGNTTWKYDGQAWILVPKIFGSFVSQINDLYPDANGKITLVIPDPDLSGLATQEEVQQADQTLQEGINTINEILPDKLDTDPSQTVGRVIFVGPDGKLVGQGNFTFNAATGQLKVNSTTANSNYKTIVGGSVLVEGAVLAMNSYLSTLIMGDGAANFITDGTGLHIRLFNNDLTDRPDASKSIKLRNKGFVFQDLYIEPLTFNEGGEVLTWRQINKIEKFVKMPDLPVSSGAYSVVVRNEATKELELVPATTIGGRKRIQDLPLIDDEDLSGLEVWDEYRTSGGFTKYKLPSEEEGAGTFTTEFTSEFY